MDGSTVIAVPIALGAAAAFGGAGYLQHVAAHQAPPRGPLRPRLLWDLLQIRGFRWSIVLSALAFAFQVSALSLAPLALVQPLLITQLIVFLGLVTVRQHRTQDRKLLLGAGLAAVGLTVFLLTSRPSPTPPGVQISGGAALTLGLTLAGVVIAALVAASRLPSEWRSVCLAVACAVCYGVTAGLVRTLSLSGWGSLFQHWELYAIVVIAPLGFLLNQNAFQNGVLGSVAVSIITVGDPIVSITVGAIWLGETLAVGWGWTTA
ncbi:MAG: DMT family transporter, partial [Microlunatus sp.]|nr:DMT family transporter [Microlunatus sp.]